MLQHDTKMSTTETDNTNNKLTQRKFFAFRIKIMCISNFMGRRDLFYFYVMEPIRSIGSLFSCYYTLFHYYIRFFMNFIDIIRMKLLPSN